MLSLLGVWASFCHNCLIFLNIFANPLFLIIILHVVIIKDGSRQSASQRAMGKMYLEIIVFVIVLVEMSCRITFVSQSPCYVGGVYKSLGRRRMTNFDFLSPPWWSFSPASFLRIVQPADIKNGDRPNKTLTRC